MFPRARRLQECLAEDDGAKMPFNCPRSLSACPIVNARAGPRAYRFSSDRTMQEGSAERLSNVIRLRLSRVAPGPDTIILRLVGGATWPLQAVPARAKGQFCRFDKGATEERMGHTSMFKDGRDRPQNCSRESSGLWCETSSVVESELCITPAGLAEMCFNYLQWERPPGRRNGSSRS